MLTVGSVVLNLRQAIQMEKSRRLRERILPKGTNLSAVEGPMLRLQAV